MCLACDMLFAVAISWIRRFVCRLLLSFSTACRNKSSNETLSNGCCGSCHCSCRCSCLFFSSSLRFCSSRFLFSSSILFSSAIRCFFFFDPCRRTRGFLLPSKVSHHQRCILRRMIIILERICCFFFVARRVER